MISGRWLQAAQQLRGVHGLDPAKLTWDVLLRSLEMRISSGHHSARDGEFVSQASVGVTATPSIFLVQAPIHILIAADLVWPLLVKNFSESEKMMISFVIATTIVHEFMVC